MHQKLKILFDGTLFIDAYQNDVSRTGTFFVAQNVFKELAKKKDIELTLFSSHSFDTTKLRTFLLENNLSNVNINIIKPYKFLMLFDRLKCLKRLHKEQHTYVKYLGIKFFTFLISPAYLVLKACFLQKLIKISQNFDAALSPMHHLPNFNIPKYTILYDCIPIIFPEYFKRSPWFDKLLRSLNHDDYYFAISNSTRNDFLKFYPDLDHSKVHVSLLAADERFKPASKERINEVRLKYKIPKGNYVFSLCTLEPRKNLLRIVRTFVTFLEKYQLHDWYLVLGGTHWKRFINQLDDTIKASKYSDKIIKIGYVDDDDVAPLYSGSMWFVYTPAYEGFGLPPLEAMSCGCPVIVSNNSSLPEVVDEAGIKIDFDSDEQHLAAYENYYNDPDLRHKNAQKGLERAKQFSWEKTTDQIVRVMKKTRAEHFLTTP